MKPSRKSANGETGGAKSHPKVEQGVRELNAKLVALHEHAARLASDDTIDSILNHTLDAMNYALGFDYADYAMAEDGWLRSEAHRGMKRGYPDLRLDGPGIIVKAANQKKAIRISDTRKETAYVEARKEMLSELAVPVILDDQTVGVLNVESARLDAFTNEDQQLLETLASHVSSCLSRLRGEQSLRRSESKMRGILDALPGLVFELDSHGVFTYYYTATRDDLAAPPEVFLGRSVRDVLPSKLADSIETAMEAAAKTGTVQVFEYQLPTLDGKLVDWEAHISSAVSGSFICVVYNVTERKKADERLRQSEERYRSLIDGMLDGTYRSTHDGRFVDVNPAFVNMFGYSNKQEMLDISSISKELYFLPDERGSHILDTGQEEVEVYRMRRKDGSEIWVEDHGRYVHDEHGNVLFHEGVLRDVTERVQAEERLRQSEERYRSLIDGMLDGTYRSTHDGRFVDVNPAFVNMFGYSNKQEMLDISNVSKALYFSPDDRASLFLDTGQERVEVFRMRRKDGSEIWVEDHGRYVHDEHGNVLFHEGVLRDVTERIRAEEALRESEKRYRDLVEMSPDAVAVHDGKKLLFVNPSAAKILGVEPGNVVGMEMTRFVAPDFRPVVAARVKKALKDGKEAPLIEERFLRLDGNVVDVEVATMPVTWHGTPAVLVAFRDVTERRLMADERRRYSEHLEELVEERTKKLREAERMAAMGQLATQVAHDLRNPLTGITGAVYYLRKKYGSAADEKTKEMLDVIEKDVEYSNDMMTGLVEYSGETKLNLVETDLRTITEKALALVRVPTNIHVSNLIENLPRAKLDVEKMTRVSVNLIQNAVEAMPQGGELTITSQSSERSLRLLFSDTGTGIKKEIMSRIWVPFSTTKAKGLGLGLPMVKQIAEAHGGSVSIESAVGKGTTVIVSLPINATTRVSETA